MKLTERQEKALDLLTTQWSVAPIGIYAQTLLSLKERGVIECKINPCVAHLKHYLLDAQYNSLAYLWRKKGEA